MKQFSPSVKGEVRVKPGKRVIWLSRPSSLSVGLSVIAVGCVIVALIVVGVPVVPWVWYRVQPAVVGRLEQLLARPVTATTSVTTRQVDTWLPLVDTQLAQGHELLIPSLGVKTIIGEAALDQYEQVLQRGPWRVPDFGTPDNRTLPMIVTAHRYGYLSWSNSFRRLHSFFNLPKLKPGDRVFVAWDQRLYTYEVYGGDEGTMISDYSADLILYTCQYLESDRRIFKYARLIKE